MTKIIFISLFVTAFCSCKKNEPSGVMIRIENNTNFTLDSAKLVYDTTNYNYGTILPRQATEYIFFNSMPDAPAARADSANIKIIAGRFLPPNSYPTPILASGKYTLQIFPDSNLFYHYNARFIKN